MSGYPLCDVCRSCLAAYGTELDHQESFTFEHHAEVQSLEESVGAKCPICTTMLCQLKSSMGPGIALDHQIVLSTDLQVQPSYRFAAEGAYNVSGFVDCEFTRRSVAVVDFELFRKEDVIDYYSASLFPTSTGSLEAWDTVLQWFGQCISQHTECQTSDELTRYPSRLLDVGDANEGTVKLVITSNTRMEGRYLTLSHRWGDAVNVKLTQSTLGDFVAGFPVASLPLTFRQAIEITRRLKQRYLWIDSLCIIQDEDDRADWLQQAGQMEKIYFHSFLNLAATGSVDSSQGLYRNRDPVSELKPSAVSLAQTVTDEQHAEPGEFILFDIDFLQRELDNAPLNLRAWVLQERLLSHRILHFGSGQLFWECKRGILCERFSNEMPYFMEADFYAVFKQFKVRDSVGSITQSDHSRTSEHRSVREHEISTTDLRVWEKIVLAYSQSQLTYHSDRVIAISGVAKALRNTLQTSYLAGLWRDKLEEQLLWRVERTPHQSPFRPATYRAPTWSWLSVEGAIDYNWFTGDVLFLKVLDVSLAFATADDTGLVKDGSLTVSGRLRRLSLHNRHYPPRPGSSVKPAQARVQANGLLAWDWIVEGRNVNTGIARDNILTYLDVLPEFSNDTAQAFQHSDLTNLFMLPVGGPGKIRLPKAVRNNPSSAQDDEIYPHHHMLILECVDRDRGVFHRVGTATLNTQKQPGVWAALAGITDAEAGGPDEDDDEARIPCVRYDEVRGEHIIVIK